MRFGRCKLGCSKIKWLTKHSLAGNHKPPYTYGCRECHDKVHGIVQSPHKINKKYARGTKKQHKKS